MPGFNGAGPMGMGPMTGRGHGYCISYVGQGKKIGPQLGQGGGRGRRHCSYATGMPRWARLAPETDIAGSISNDKQELDFLKEQVNSLEKALKQARRRIDELENKK